MSGAHVAVDEDIANEVAAFLRAHPSFLCENPDLYRVLMPPNRGYGEAMADHMAAMIRAERAHAAASAAKADGMVSAGRAAAGLADRVHDAVLALMRAPDPIECVQVEFAALLGIDAANLCAEGKLAGARPLPRGTVQRLMRGREVLFRPMPTETALLHGEAAGLARADAIVRIKRPGGDVLLTLAARSEQALRREGAGGALGFLGRALAAALERGG